MATLAVDFLPSFGSVLNILYAALGLGLVIFFHELGHFMVAKWCDVYVERFSIGFGPILYSFKKGETEYALSAVPFGGYVKMLGQDDADPSQLTSEEIAEDPRSYSAKTVFQRMAIISAGVIMNIITGFLFYAIAFGFGVDNISNVAGVVPAGTPAWVNNIQSGDVIQEVNGEPIKVYGDLLHAVALSDGPLAIKGQHADGTPFEKTVQPDESGRRRVLGISPASSLECGMIQEGDEKSAAVPGLAASKAEPPFQAGDKILKIDDEPATGYASLLNLLAKKRKQSVKMTVSRPVDDDGKSEKSEDVVIDVPANPFHQLGIWVDTGDIAAIQKDSLAAEAGLEVGDKITKIDGKTVGTDFDPLRIPEILADKHGKDVVISIRRPVAGGEPKDENIHIVPRENMGWVETPVSPGVPLAVPAIGMAFHLSPVVMHVVPGSPAEKAEIQIGENIQQLVILPDETTDPEAKPWLKERVEIKFGKKDPETNRPMFNWAHAFLRIQSFPQQKIELLVAKDGETRTVALNTYVPENNDWYRPARGIALLGDSVELKAANVSEALAMGIRQEKVVVSQIYATISSLFSGRISPKEMRGPVGIATVAFKFAESGFPALCFFLGFLSVNLAVLNFLPIPVLDGGHMVFLIWEAVTRRRPSERVLVAATYAGMMFVLGLMIMVLYLDIFVHGF